MCCITSCFPVVNQLLHQLYLEKCDVSRCSLSQLFSLVFYTVTCCINKKRDTHTHLKDCCTTASGDDIPVLREVQCHLHGKVICMFLVHQDLSFSYLLHTVVSNSVISTEAFFFYVLLHSLTFCRPNCVFVAQLFFALLSPGLLPSS